MADFYHFDARSTNASSFGSSLNSTQKAMAEEAVRSLIHDIEIIRIMSAVVAGLITIVVALRMYVRLKILRIFGPEDWTMVATFLLAMAQSAVSIVNCGLGIAIFNGHFDQFKAWATTVKVDGILYIATLIALKISLGYFFVHIFSHKPIQKTIVYSVMVTSTVVGVVYIPVGYGTCASIKPLPPVPNQPICPTEIQLAANALFGLFSVVNIGGDFTFTVMAIMALWSAQLPRPTKISACILLVLGSAGGVASLVRWVLVLEPTAPADASKELMLLVRWMELEVMLGVIAANLAMIRPLFTNLMVKIGVISVRESTVPPRSARRSDLTSMRTVKRSTKSTYPGDDLLLDDIKKRVSIQVEEERTIPRGVWDYDARRAAVPRGM